MLETWFAGLVGRKASTLALSLDTLSRVPREVWEECLSLQRIYLLDSALSSLRTEPALTERPLETEIRDNAVPVLRLKATQLSYSLVMHGAYGSPGARAWLQEAQTDPVPELRLGLFRKLAAPDAAADA
jgi:hypothetical protein